MKRLCSVDFLGQLFVCSDQCCHWVQFCQNVFWMWFCRIIYMIWLFLLCFVEVDDSFVPQAFVNVFPKLITQKLWNDQSPKTGNIHAIWCAHISHEHVGHQSSSWFTLFIVYRLKPTEWINYNYARLLYFGFLALFDRDMDGLYLCGRIKRWDILMPYSILISGTVFA